MGMEDETKGFLLRIVNTLSIVLIWMFINLIAGIYFGLAFFDNKPTLTNFIYYLFFLASLSALLLHLKKRWKL